jgi:geranylgeranyl pyrophosphate synthase
MSSPEPAWWERRRTDVCRRALSLVARAAASPGQLDLLEAVLASLRHDERGERFRSPVVLLPMLVHAGVRGDDERAVPLAAAATLLEAGIHLLDDLADVEVPAGWRGYDLGQLTLAATGVIAVLPHLALLELDAPPSVLVMLEQTLAEGLMRVGAGQQQDLRLTGRASASASEIQAVLVAKSGERPATYAAMAARLAGAAPGTVEAYAALGRALGTAAALAADCRELFTGDASDLARGAASLPVALYAERLDGERRARFEQSLRQARHEPAAREEVRRAIRATSVPRHCALLVETYCQRALRALAAAGPLDPWRDGLRTLVAECSPAEVAARSRAAAPG